MALQKITLLVEDKVLKNCKNKDVLEVALRDKNARFECIEKAKIIGENIDGDQKEIVNKALGLVNKDIAAVKKANRSLNRAVNDIRVFGDQIESLSDGIKNMSGQVGSIFNGVKFLKSMAFLNVGLSVANLMVSVAGFCYMSGKLQDINKKLQTMDRKLDDLKNINKNELLGKYRRFTIEIARIADKEKHHEEISLTEREELLDEMNEYLFKVILDINDNALEMSVLSEVVYSLIVPYSRMVGEYVQEYYLVHKELPSTLHSYEDPMEKLLSKEYSDRMFNYWYFEQDEPNRDVMNAMAAQKLLLLKCVTYIQDRIDLVREFDTRDKLNQYEEVIDRAVKEEVFQSLQEAMDTMGVDTEQREQIMAAVRRA